MQQQTEQQEVWKSIPGFLDYEVSSHGQVRSYKRSDIPINLVLCNGPGGYQLVSLVVVQGRRLSQKVHLLVLLAFVGPRPSGYCCRHLDGVRTNNHLSNLKYGTPVENAADMVLHGTSPVGAQNGNSRLTDTEVLEIRELLVAGVLTMDQIASRFQISAGMVGHISNGRNWTHLLGDNAKLKRDNRGNRRLHKVDVVEIFKLLDRGMSQSKIAKRFGCSQNAISGIKLGKNWGWVRGGS